MELDSINNDNLIARYLSGEASPAELDNINSLLKSDDSFRKLFNDQRFIWEQASLAGKDINSDWLLISDRIGFRKSQISPFSFFSRVAAILVVILSVSAALWVHWNVPGYGRWVAFETGTTSDSLQLPDASLVYLNSNSSLKFRNSFGGAERAVVLDGEGYFEIVSNLTKPFKVYTGNVTVEVTGTSFHVDATPGNEFIEVNVTNGAVLVDNGLRREVMTSGQRIRVNDKIMEAGLIVNNNFKSWKTGLIEFSNASLDEICLTLDKHFGEINRVIINTHSNITVTTRFQGLPVNDVLNELSIHFQKNFALNNGTLTISE